MKVFHFIQLTNHLTTEKNKNMSNIISNQVTVRRSGNTSALYFTADSGKIIYRDKVDTLIGIKHPGIVLGADAWGTVWVIHNHYQIGHPQIETLEKFADGNNFFYDNRAVFYSPMEIIERAISHWMQKKQYSWLFHNCQHFVNKVTQNESYSETIDKVSDNTMLAGGVVTLFALLTGNKAALQAGLTIAGVGATGKVVNRINRI